MAKVPEGVFDDKRDGARGERSEGSNRGGRAAYVNSPRF